MASERQLRGTVDKYKILIAISGCESYERSGFQQPMRETWLKDAVALGMDYKFFHGKGGTPKEDVVVVDCDDAYFDLTSKLKEKCKWALDNGYDFMFSCFPDTYANAERLLQCGFDSFDYFGDLLYHPNGDYCQGGAGYFLSRRAFEYAAKHPSNYPNDDCWLGDRMRENTALKRGDSRYFVHAGASPLAGPLKNNLVVSCHLSPYEPNGYQPEQMYRKHELWRQSVGESTPVPRPAVAPTLLDTVFTERTFQTPETPVAPRRLVRQLR